ncbi:hypothetical protein WK77_16445 [Burkholderia ubonensis]|nr:hypothetical protein WK77_16445 [Burkholderia ubonensis]
MTDCEDIMSEGNTLLIKQLRDIGTNAIAHLYRGSCPDQIEGSDVRDDECPACRVLIEADKLLA